MNLKDYIDQIKQDVKRSLEATNMLTKELDQTYYIRIIAVFVLNILGIIGFTILKEDFPLSVFIILWGISAFVLIDVLWHIFSENIAKNMPDIFDKEYQKRGKPKQDFKCYLNFVGHTHFRGFNCHVYIYENAVIFKFAKKCLVVDNAQYIKLSEAVFGYRCEVDKNGQYVQCNMNQQQAETLRQWQNKKSEK